MLNKILLIPLLISSFTAGLIINFIQGILFLTLRTLSKKWYSKVNRYFGLMFYGHIVFLVEWWAGVKLTIYMDKLDVHYLGTEHCIPVVNHCYPNDWMFLLHFGSKCKLILGNCRAFAKKSLKWIPVVGWFFYFNEYIFLERSFERDQEILERRVRDMLAFTPDPLVLSVAKCPALYDYTVVEKGDYGTPTLAGIFNRIPYEVTIFVRRMPLKFVPEDSAKAALWLHERFVEKDNLVDSYKKTGSMFTQSGFDEPMKVEYKRSLLVLANTIFWFIVTSTIYIYYTLRLFSN
uniref:Phospholipid/glycerol acyltransferase domain-containing protein n=1 Tax=Megaselia scalaris TaxID=36166 RepID=T1GZA2_MEGSC